MRLIDSGMVKDLICSGISTDTEADQEYVCKLVDKMPYYTTKSVKYFDEDEKVWKVGEVIVDE